MRSSDILRLSLNSLMHRKLRSWLTVLGIVIGVAAVVALVSIGEGMQTSINERLGGLGADIITISAGRLRAFGGFGQMRGMGQQESSNNLTTSDLRVVKSMSGVLYANGIISGRAEATYLAKTASVSVEGVDTATWKHIETTELSSGRYLGSGDTYVAVIGSMIATDVFDQDILVNRQIKIGDQTFRVVGILESSGSMGQADSTIYIPIGVARNILSDLSPTQLSSIIVKVEGSETVEDVIVNIEDRLMVTRHVNENSVDFTVESAQAMQETISSISDTMTLFLGGIAGISLLVGGIGVANTMFMSVIERTRLIGVLKALGTTNFEVIKLFLAESAIMGLVGGAAGVLVGFLLSIVMPELGLNVMGMGGGGGGMTTVVTPQLALGSIGFSVVIGVVSGIFPARRAASLQPIEALRYE